MKLPFIFFFLISNYSQAQEANLVANGDFKDRNVCTEFNARCAPEAWFFIPDNILPTNGNYEVLSMGDNSGTKTSRNYIYTMLLCPLKAGKQYRFSIKIKIPKGVFDHIDIWLGESEPGLFRDQAVNPVFSLTNRNIFGEVGQWINLTYTYKALGSECFLLLGNLSDLPLANKKDSRSKKTNILYYISEVSLFPLDTSEISCPKYDFNMKLLYDINFRHPAPLISKILSSVHTDIDHTIDTPVVTKTYIDTLLIPDVLFETNSGNINLKFLGTLDSLLEYFQFHSIKKITVTGFTDDVGNKEHNMKLSLERAQSIKTHLINKFQLQDQTIEIHGRGENSPIASNKIADGRQQNRRVEIVIIK